MSGYDWIGTPKPVETSAPLFPEGSRKRYDPRAGTKAGGGAVPPIGPPVITFVGNEDGSPASTECANGLLLFSDELTVSGHAAPHASVRLWMVLDYRTKVQVGATQAAADGSWSIDVQVRDEGRRCFVADQTLPGSTSSVWSAPVCVMVGSCDENYSPLPVITGGDSQGDCYGLPIYNNPVLLRGTGEPTAVVSLYLSDGPNAGSLVGQTVVDSQGQWLAQLTVNLAEEEDHCVVAVQQVPGSGLSAPTAPHCFFVAACPVPDTPDQITDLETAGLRYSPVENWQYGTLAYEIDGEWVYGVLNRVVEVTRNG